jgi:1-deoxy-D-xylulose-5-phosphate synthase
LIRFLEDALEINGPVLIHALTVKGKGYPYAERDSRKFHGLGAFDADSGEIRASPGSRPTFTQAFGDIICRIAGNNPDVVAITAAMPDGTGLSRFEKAFPDRFFDVAMAEQHAVCFAAGMATAGKRPVAAIYSTFLQRAYDQVIHDVCIQDLPVLFAVDRAGIVGQDGETHQGAFDIAYLRTVPNIVLAAPKDEWELEQMMLLALDQPHPFAVRYPRAEIPDFPEADNESLFLGRGQLLREGNDLCIIALGPHCRPALDAAEGLSRRGIEAAVLNARFAKPLPEEQIIQLAACCGRVVTVEDGALMGGFGSAVLELLADRKDISVKVRRIGIPDRVIEHGTRDEMLRECGMDAAAIESAALSLFDDRPSAAFQQAYAMVIGKVVQG